MPKLVRHFISLINVNEREHDAQELPTKQEMLSRSIRSYSWCLKCVAHARSTAIRATATAPDIRYVTVVASI